ncbi:similar to PLANT HOMOLOGOUS TO PARAFIBROMIN [Actinidia rufa]|uniref:Similar to PLANT HOMOLOGOUS TO PARAFIBROMIN n=1 Tax=Actinidia rufa TaxID=165716 RepID=A0A7J0DJU0_9ERIC|nr:similar to PLANT HOMOLOGOUS TO PARAFIBROMIN [Actinidia rufa]
MDGHDRDEFSEITLRLFDLSDVDDIMEWAIDDKVSQFFTWDTYTSKEQAMDFIKNQAIPHRWLRAISFGERAIGSIYVTPGSEIAAKKGELAYALASKYWGKGIATRAVKIVVGTIFREWPNLERLEALVDLENLGSQRVLEKAGFHKEGVLRKWAFFKGRSRDFVIFSLLATVSNIYLPRANPQHLSPWIPSPLSGTSPSGTTSTRSSAPVTISVSAATSPSPAASPPPTAPSRAASTPSKPSSTSSSTTTSSTLSTCTMPAPTTSPPSPSSTASPSSTTSMARFSSSDAIQFVNPKFSAASADEYHPEDTGLVPIAATDNGFDGNEESRVRVLENYMSMIRSTERPLKDRETILECKNRNFYDVLAAGAKREEERQKAESQQRKDGLVAKNRLMRGDERGFGEEMGYDTTPRPKMSLKGSKIGEGVPIILVPSAFQTLITIYNVKEFLEDGVFIPTDVKVKQMKGPKPDCVTVQKKFSRDRVVTAYEVRDKPSALKAEDWDRVVAVFVLGKEWQFKEWPFQDHVEIFNKVLGFYMRFEDDSVESAKNVKQWNVKIISISKNKRHQDRAAALEVWDRLEEFMRSRSRG